jgi:phosphomannomutase
MSVILLALGRLWASPGVHKGLIFVGACVAVAVAFAATYHAGKVRGAATTHLADVDRERASVAAADAKYRKQEIDNANRIDAIRVAYTKAETTAAVVDSAAVRALDSGVRRVRIAVTRCDPNPTAPGATPTRVDDTPSAELPGPIAATLYAIAADGDQAIRQLTALQAWARSAVALCNGDPQK